jgi:hypothetical protein
MESTFENIVLYIVSMGAPTVLIIMLGLQYFKTRHRERMAIIEKGGELPKFTLNEFLSRSLVLKTGLFLIGISLGVLVGFHIIHYTKFAHLSGIEETAYFITIPFFTGIVMIVNYFIKK